MKEKSSSDADPELDSSPPRTYLGLKGETNLEFGLDDIEVERDFYTGEKRKIPRIRVHVKRTVTVDIYGSHLETGEDVRLTHLHHNPTKINPVFNADFSQPIPNYVWRIMGARGGWILATEGSKHLEGAPLATIFQKVGKDINLNYILSVVGRIQKSKTDFVNCQVFPGGLWRKSHVGEELLDFLVPAIRNFDFKKLDLLKKCVQYYQANPMLTKADRYFNCLHDLVRALDRPPTPVEMYDKITEGNFRIQLSRFYKDLKTLGMGWLNKKRAK